MQEKELRRQLINLLKGGQAHMTFSEVVSDFPLGLINTKPQNVAYSFWDLLEHIRITQWDILDFIRNPHYKEISWPDEYWPPKNKKATEKEWNATIAAYERDLKELEALVLDDATDFYTKIPHGTGQNILKEIMVVADHASYHIGEFGILRQVMKAWPRKNL